MNIKRYKFYAIILLLLLMVSKSTAQGNLPFADDKRVHFGFLLGTNLPDFAIIPTDIEQDVSVPSLIPGFSVGAIGDLRLGKQLNLRFTPTLILNQRIIHYADNSYEDLLSVPMYLPVYLKYSAIRNGNFRPYLVGGGGVWVDWGRNKEKGVLLKPFDMLIEVGVGCDIYFPFFKLAPEIKFGIGVNNMLTPLDQRHEGALVNPNTNKHTTAIQKLTTRMISIAFNFE